ncbi:MAG: response regulator [Deltaproteobacteria bacterium]|nr:response regulator [Deltaproteobacteria bacterium]
MSEQAEKKTILIADDDADTRAIVGSAIQMLGHEYVEAGDGAQALVMAKQLKVDLAILDVMMPEMNGNEVCEGIKTLEHGKFIPVLMLTARDSVKDKVSALDGGADDYLTKPFHYQELQARINALLRVRDLNLSLREKNLELQAMQEKLVQQERQILVSQLAGTAAHQLGQPLSAIMLNCHLIETLPPGDERSKKALSAIKADSKRMAELIEKLRTADASKTASYHGKTAILNLDDSKK